MLLSICVSPAMVQKNISSVRVCKIGAPRQSLPDRSDQSMCPEDEFTIFFYIGKKLIYLLILLVMDLYFQRVPVC